MIVEPRNIVIWIMEFLISVLNATI